MKNILTASSLYSKRNCSFKSDIFGYFVYISEEFMKCLASLGTCFLSTIIFKLKSYIYLTFSMQWKAKSISLILAFFYLSSISTSKRTNKKSLHSTNILKSQSKNFCNSNPKLPSLDHDVAKTNFFLQKSSSMAMSFYFFLFRHCRWFWRLRTRSNFSKIIWRWRCAHHFRWGSSSNGSSQEGKYNTWIIGGSH